MSYLHPVRVHFSGHFRADVSTVNNDPAHFDNDNFRSNFQIPGATNGWWQPAGTGAWRLVDCKVTRACRADGSSTSDGAEDAAVDLAVREAADRSSAKMVDLDPDQQGVSMVFGLAIRLVDGQGRMVAQGDFESVAFFDLNFRRSSAGGPAGASAYYQSVLTNVGWDDPVGSLCLAQMKQASTPGFLSIKFITDQYVLGGQNRGYGRITGTIGPYLTGEPRTFVIGRHLTPGEQSGFAPVDCLLDHDRRKVLVDVGNALPVDVASGDFLQSSGSLTLAAGSAENAVALGPLDYTGTGDFAKSAGVYELPTGRTLTDAELATLTVHPLRLQSQPDGANAPVDIMAESDDGVYVRAERFVLRLDPGISESTVLIATRFGLPFAGATPRLQVQPFSLPDTSPLPMTTIDAKTGADGRATLTVTAVDPGRLRGFIDGQVYAITFSLLESDTVPSDFDPGNFISLLMFSGMMAPASPGWDHVHPIFEQYSHLYPRPHGPDPYAPFAGLPPSHPVVNLDDYDSVVGFARHIARALALPIDHPNHMPVTRDLSGAKRVLLLNWLSDVGTDGKPKRTGAPAVVVATQATVATPAQPVRFAAKAFGVRRELIRHAPASEG
ncbi:MAG: hypothetical protein ABIR79_16050 [Candidatus Binatia bacterium]